MIRVEGGTLHPKGTWVDAGTREQHVMWEARSDHTGLGPTFMTKSLAEYFLWAINERAEGEAYRKNSSTTLPSDEGQFPS